VRTRLVIVLGGMILWGVGLEARLVWLQAAEHDTYVKQAQGQQFDRVPSDARRGDVRDRNGQLLAYSVESFDIKANPSVVKDAAAEAGELCAALADCSAADRAQLVATFNKKKIKDVVVRQALTVSPEMADRVRALLDARAKALRKKGAIADNLPAINALWLERHSVRYYPKMDVAAHLVGFLKGDGTGAAGVEAQFESKLSGTKGRILRQVDGRTNEILTRVERAPEPGTSIELTIDTRLQQITDRELKAGVLKTGALGGAAIMMDPATGEILALSSYPTFNPNAPNDGVSENEWRNRAIVNIYEPGSTFKIVTASAALEEGVFKPSTLIDTEPGILRFPGGRIIREAKGHNYHVLSFEDVIVKSSNVGASKIGLQVGGDRMMQYVRRLGFGQRIAPDFGGETVGMVPKSGNISDSTLASLSMGYEVGVTPIQMVGAVATVANGGVMMEPHVVRAYVRDGRREEVLPKVVRRAISAETAATLTAIMEGVVELPHGTGTAARMARYQVAGKTGTASKFEDHHYSKTDYNVSFVGFVPSRKPVYAILVVVDAPSIGPAYGGEVSAPIFHRIAEAALQYAGIAPTINPTAPVIVAGHAPLIEPPAPFKMPVLTNIGGRSVMPDLRGMSLRDANRVASQLGLSMASDGDGFVTAQTPQPGEFLPESGRGSLQLHRLAPKPSGGTR
jgi:cell division protein FtsI/penicillin-binding protein 2